MKKYNLDIIRFINLFENVTHADVKDCFLWNEIIVFIVAENQAKKAVGQNGKNVKKLSNLLRKRIKIVQYESDPVKFIKGFISPITAESVDLDGKIILIKVNSAKDKGMLIGRDSKNLNMLKNLVEKYFNLEGIRIL